MLCFDWNLCIQTHFAPSVMGNAQAQTLPMYHWHWTTVWLSSQRQVSNRTCSTIKANGIGENNNIGKQSRKQYITFSNNLNCAVVRFVHLLNSQRFGHMNPILCAGYSCICTMFVCETIQLMERMPPHRFENLHSKMVDACLFSAFYSIFRSIFSFQITTKYFVLSFCSTNNNNLQFHWHKSQ